MCPWCRGRRFRQNIYITLCTVCKVDMHACVASVAISTTADMKIIVNKLLLVRGIESNFEA